MELNAQEGYVKIRFTDTNERPQTSLIFSGLIVLAFVFGSGMPDSTFTRASHIASNDPNPGSASDLILIGHVNQAETFSTIELYPNIETMGVVVNGTSLPKTAQLMYQQSDESTWHTGHPLVLINGSRLIGSLFGLSPTTSYNIKVLDGSQQISGSTTTQADELQFNPAVILHVNRNAPSGGDGTSAAPYQSIQEAVNIARPGTQVLVADGVYHESVSFPASGSAGNWIQVKAEGHAAILEGSEDLSGNIWTPLEGKSKIWSTKIETPTGYLARDQIRYYMYDDRSGLLQGLGHNDVPMNEGWYFDPSTSRLYVRSLDDPSNHTWQVPTLDKAFNLVGRDWLWIEGFEIRFYGANDSCGVCTENASHVVIRKNKIHNVQKGIFINWTGGEDRGNDTRIEYNEIYDPPVNEWPWKAVKGSWMEGTGIIIRGHIGEIVRGNDVHNFFNGIYTGSSGAMENSALAFDADIYNNHIHQISDDALEPEGACINHRFRNNYIDGSLVGISLAPITQGPTWVLRSVYSNISGRDIKWDRNSDGVVLIYHNTFWTNMNNVNGMDLISPVSNAAMRNNIFQISGYAVNEVPTGSVGHDWNNDNWFTTRDANSPHFKWGNVDLNNISQFCSAAGLECNGFEGAPGLTNPGAGDFTLLSSSPNINRGVVIPGINDNFSGTAPDVGAYEFVSTSAPLAVSSTKTDVNPTSAASVNFTVTFSESVTGVDSAAPFKDFGLSVSPGITGASITSVTQISGTTYKISINTGLGNGTIRLDILDDDSIVDSAGTPLGGVGAGNGNFTSGELYTVDKALPTVTGVSIPDSNPSSSDIVHFNVGFSKPVSGVEASDFSITTTGNISAAVITDVSGSGTTYTVAVQTGNGDGTLRLDLMDDDSIKDASGNPLGGTGAGNGNFTTGSVYSIDKSAPSIISSQRMDPNPSDADSVRFTVTFSEAVSGVDAGDFNLTTSDGLSGASISNVSGSANTYLVTIFTGSGSGTVRLDLADNDSIVDATGKPLGGIGAGNGNFTGGEAYVINKPSVNLLNSTFKSSGSNDGWVLESSENSNRGGSTNSSAATFNLGDDKQDRQFRAILHFPTASLPDNAIVTQLILMIKNQGVVGTNPFITHQNINVDIRKGFFGSAGLFGTHSLDSTDFQAPASKSSVGTIYNNPVSGWYWTLLDSSANQFINLQGVTQFRLMFQLDDNDDMGADYLTFYSGNSSAQADRPQLQVEYYIPK
jgi:hypothetical protein